jgi:predicted nucleic acid-binding protein
MIYLDTSTIVALLTHEPATAAVTAWFAATESPMVSADWCAVEFASAIAIKQRMGSLRPAHARRAHAAFKELSAGGLQLLPIGHDAFRHAADLCRPWRNGLRAGDALHLAVAVDAGAEMIAGLDQRMNAAALRLGLRLAFDSAPAPEH